MHEWQRDLSLSFNLIGNILEAKKKPEEALRYYEQALAITEKLAQLDPSNAT